MEKAKPSRTAYKVALNVITLGSKPGMDRVLPPGIVDATEALLLASGAIGERTVKWARTKNALFLYEAFDWMLPGQFEAFAHRKAFCEGQARDGISAGATQILVLGAGYDTLGWRLAPEFPGVNFFEIDHPATAALKGKGIHEVGRRENLFLIPEDLGKRNLVDTLKNMAPWHRAHRTVIIAEGLVMYLSPAAVRGLFRQCAAVSGPGSRMAFSYIPTGADGRPDAGPWTGLMLWLQKLVGEKWLWSVRPEELRPFLEKTGWTLLTGLEGTTEKHGVEYYAAAELQCQS
jgi:methyltransferase (TIGR00027 family)